MYGSFYIIGSVFDGSIPVWSSRGNGYLNGLRVVGINANLTTLTSDVTTLDVGLFNGDIAEIIVFPKVLTDTQRRKVERYLSIKYNIPVACGTVSQWSDQSGNARHASQSTADYRPLLVQGGLNGRPVLRFDAVDDRLASGTFSVPISGATGLTLFAVSKDNSTGYVNNYSVMLASPTARCVWFGYAYGRVSLATRRITGETVASIGTGAARIDTTDPILMSGVVNYTTQAAAVYRNGAQTATGATTSAGVLETQTLLTIPYLDLYSDTSHAAIIVYNRVLSDAERQRVERWLATRYGITLE